MLSKKVVFYGNFHGFQTILSKTFKFKTSKTTTYKNIQIGTFSIN